MKIDFPAIIPGASGVSGAGQSAQGKHVGGLRDNSHMGAFKNLKWDERIPEFYSVPTVWAYSLLKAVEVSGIDLNKVNFFSLYTKCLIYQRQFSRFTTASIRHYIKAHGLLPTSIGMLGGCVFEAWSIFCKLCDRFKHRYMSIKKFVITNQSDTLSASAALEVYVSDSLIALDFEFK